jgi:hypothetical protein
MMELSEFELQVNNLKSLFEDSEYFTQWFDEATVQKAQLIAAHKVLPQLIAEWQLIKAQERERNALSK